MEIHRELLDLLDAATPVSRRHLVHRVRDTGRKLDLRTALVGGVARDTFRAACGQLQYEQLGGEILDYDIVVEGDGIAFAYELATRLPGELTLNRPFMTATLLTADGIRIDIATARTEYYEAPGLLPVVATAGVTLDQDLGRRDFTVNALAIDLSHDVGKLIDPLGGGGDIRDRLVRVIHPASFIDDPTRIFRAMRYAIRLDYNLEPVTRTLLTTAVEESVVDCLTPERIRYEIECIGSELRWSEIWAVCDLIGLTGSLSPGLTGVSGSWELEDARALDVAIRNQADMLADEGIPPWLVRTAWVLVDAPGEVRQVAERIGISGKHLRLVAKSRELVRQVVRTLNPGSLPSEVSRLLEQFPRQTALLGLFMMSPNTEEEVAVKKQVLKYINDYSGVRIEMSGADLLAMGFRPGPLLGQVRDQLRYLRLDGVINSLDEEIEYANRFLQPGIEIQETDNGT